MYFIRKSKTNPSGYWPLNNLQNAVNTGNATINLGTPSWHAPPVYGTGGSLLTGNGGVRFLVPSTAFQSNTMGDYFYLECFVYWVSGETGLVKLFGHEVSDGLRVSKNNINFTIIHQNKTVSIDAPVKPGDVYLVRVVHTGTRVSLYINDIEQAAYDYDGTEGPMSVAPANTLNFGSYAGDSVCAVSHVVISTNPYVPVEYEPIIDNTSRVLTATPGTLLDMRYLSSATLEWTIEAARPISDGEPLFEDDYLTADTLSHVYFNFPIEPGEGSTIYGVMLEFDSNNLVEVSMDGETWSTATTGALAPAVTTSNVSELTLTIRARLEPGTQFKHLKATLIDSNNASGTSRPIILSGGTVLRDRFSPLFSVSDYLALNGQLSIGAEPGTTETAISFWYKGSSLSVSGQTPTVYVNGQLYSAELMNNKWVNVSMSGLTLPAVLSGNGVLANIMAHPSLTQAQAQGLYQAYTNNVISAPTTDAIVIGNDSAQGYDYDWEIVAGGR